MTLTSIYSLTQSTAKLCFVVHVTRVPLKPNKTFSLVCPIYENAKYN